MENLNKINDVYIWTATWAKKSHLTFWQADEVSSTNTIAKDDENVDTKPQMPRAPALAGAPTVYLARNQTQGRGRGDHSWSAPAGSALLSSWSFGMAAVPQPILSPLIGLALYEAAQKAWPELKFNLKAPNDLFIGSLKVAGLLIETVEIGAERRTVVGLGLNASSHPTDVPTATCLQMQLEAARLPALAESDWQVFLAAWREGLSQAMIEGQSAFLKGGAMPRLCAALNRHPLIKEPILRVDELGQLHTKSRVIHWQEL